MAGVPVTFVGEIFYTNLGVGGGPIVPQPQPPQPPGIWGPPGPWPSPPIYFPQPPGSGAPPVPAHPIYLPPQIQHPIVIPLPPDSSFHPEHPIVIPPSGAHPEHPIVIVPPPPTEGLQPGGGKPPPADGGWGYHPVYGWVYAPAPGQPGPK